MSQNLDSEVGTLRFAFTAQIAWFQDVVQGGPSASGKKYVDIKFKDLLLAWVTG